MTTLLYFAGEMVNYWVRDKEVQRIQVGAMKPVGLEQDAKRVGFFMSRLLMNVSGDGITLNSDKLAVSHFIFDTHVVGF